ncbi:MAG: hypothetical protein OEN22_05715 [Gammaproteobacteria bacterium]|nr:hypothetical protein [Gammaproteobacteria bacterium]
MKRITRFFLAAIVTITITAGGSGNLLAQTGYERADIQQLLAGADRVAVLPVMADYYRGHPNLKVAFKKNLSWYESPELYKARFDDESARIASDLAAVLLATFDDRGFDAILPQDGEADKAVRDLHGAYWPGLLRNGMLAVIDGKEGTENLSFVDAGTAARDYVDARREKGVAPFPGSEMSDSSRIALVTSVASQAQADMLVLARFWGWRKGSGALPSMFGPKSAATLWIGFIDGQTGDLVAAGQGNVNSPFFASKQRDDKLAKMATAALSALIKPPTTVTGAAAE